MYPSFSVFLCCKMTHGPISFSFLDILETCVLLLTHRGQVHGFREAGQHKLDDLHPVLVVVNAVGWGVGKPHTGLPYVFTAVYGCHVFWVILFKINATFTQNEGNGSICRTFKTNLTSTVIWALPYK